MSYVEPKPDIQSYTCPHCAVFSDHQNGTLMQQLTTHGRGWQEVTSFTVAQCVHCKEFILWRKAVMIYPDSFAMSPPNGDLENDIQKDYLEAASVLSKSPKSSAALLRLAVQKLCKQLGEPGKKIDDDIGSLVKKGLPVEIQQALDVLRVIGNEAVHPGTINLDDDRDTAIKLFELVNIIAQTMVTNKKAISKMYESLPKSKKDAIAKRDA